MEKKFARQEKSMPLPVIGQEPGKTLVAETGTAAQSPLSHASVSVIVTTYNEAGNVRRAVNAIVALLHAHGIANYELLLIDNDSNDQTQYIIDELGADNSHIRVIHNPVNMGLGYSVRKGMELATKEYVGWFPGDDETSHETIANIFSEIAKAEHDIIVPYTFNPWIRPLRRRILSVIYTAFCNCMFGMHLRYFNGACFFRRALLDRVQMSTNSPAYMAEILIQLIKKYGVSYVEIPMFIRQRSYGTSSVVTWKNVWLIAKTLAMLFVRIRLLPGGARPLQPAHSKEK